MHGAITIPEMLDELTYRSYRHNRRLAPDVTPEGWAKVFEHGELLEARYQREVTGQVCRECGSRIEPLLEYEVAAVEIRPEGLCRACGAPE